jgi:putative ABC transport system permease protein
MAAGIRAGVRRLFRLAIQRPNRAAAEMDDELQFHIDSRVEQLVALGAQPDDARVEALRRLGGSLEQIRGRLHESVERKEFRRRVRERADAIRTDMRYAARGLVQRPALTAVAVGTLAVGIGANTTIFNAVHALILRPLPFSEAQQLMDVALLPGHATNGTQWSFPKYIVFRDAQHVFSSIALYAQAAVTLSDGEPERVTGEFISAAYLSTLGIRPTLGRDIPLAEDAHAGAVRMALIGDALWKRRFNGDPAVIGQVFDIDAKPFEIAGVLPPSFRGLSGRAEVWIPITTRAADALNEPWSLEFSMVGRLRAGVTQRQALAAVQELGARVYDAYPFAGGLRTTSSLGGRWTATATPLDAMRVSPLLRRSLLVLTGAVGLVLIIACVNLANLLLGRAVARQREIAIRLAVGAGRTRLIQQLVTESVLVALIGGVASVAIAVWGTRALSSIGQASTVRLSGLAGAIGVQGPTGLGVVGFQSIKFDFLALLTTFFVSLVVGVAFGLAPALQATRPSLTGDLADSGAPGSGIGHAWGLTTRRVLVMAEIALALVLLAGAGLMTRSMVTLLRVDPGFEARHMLTLRLTVTPGQLATDSMPGFYSALRVRLGAVPGVSGVAMADCPPLNGGCNETIITFPDRGAADPNAAQAIGVHFVTPSTFSVWRVPVKRGRLFTDADRLGQAKVIVVNEAAVRAYWPHEDPIGKRAGIWQAGFDQGATVIGVVGDTRYVTMDSAPTPDAYLPAAQAPRSSMMIFLRTTGDPSSVAGAARQAIHDLAPHDPVYDVEDMTTRVATATAAMRLSVALLALFAGVALVLAMVGIYGVMWFAVTQRTREIGIRMALGAAPATVLGLLLREGIVLAAAGVAAGLVGALAATRILRSLLYGIGPSDPLTFAAIVATIGVAALVASWLPARRASRVDPTEALRAG